jgi:hypothetical protein
VSHGGGDDEYLPPLMVNPPRPWRYEPRVRKRRPQSDPLMTKTRQELRKPLANKIDMNSLNAVRDRHLGFPRMFLLFIWRMDTGENPNRSDFYNAGLVHA